MAIQPFQKKVWLSTPTMHGEEQKWVEEAIRTNWVSTVGENINEVERLVTEKIGRRYAVGLSMRSTCVPPCRKAGGGKTLWSAESRTRCVGREKGFLQRHDL